MFHVLVRTLKEKEVNILALEEKKNSEGKGGKYLEKENIWAGKEKENGEGKRGKYVENFFGH